MVTTFKIKMRCTKLCAKQLMWLCGFTTNVLDNKEKETYNKLKADQRYFQDPSCKMSE